MQRRCSHSQVGKDDVTPCPENNDQQHCVDNLDRFTRIVASFDQQRRECDAYNITIVRLTYLMLLLYIAE